MTNPEVQHGKQPHVNPEVAVNGPLGETTIKVGGEQVPVSPEPTEAPEPEAPAAPDVVEPDAEPEPDTADSDADDTADADDTDA